jgi:membrane protein insertase Oxa1/YidC/SpoIIIJ
MVEEMFVTFGKTTQERWGRAAVMTLCLLVLVFSFAAKLSLYQPKSTQIKALASSKMWQQHEAQAAAAVMNAPDELSVHPAWSTGMVPLLTTLILMLTSLAVFQWHERETAPPVQREDFASGSQLRAPPVR